MWQCGLCLCVFVCMFKPNHDNPGAVLFFFYRRLHSCESGDLSRWAYDSTNTLPLPSEYIDVSILIGFSIINHPFRGTPIFGNTHMSWILFRACHSWSSSSPWLNVTSHHFQKAKTFKPHPKWRSLTVPIASMYGIFIYMKTHKKSSIHVGKYTSPMDAMG